MQTAPCRYPTSPYRHGVSVCVWTTEGHGLCETQSAVGVLWHNALFYRQLGCLRAACGGRAAHGGEGQHPEDREQAHQLAHTDHAVGTPDDLLFEDRGYARRGDWAVHQSL